MRRAPRSPVTCILFPNPPSYIGFMAPNFESCILELVGVFTGLETSNKYKMLDGNKRPIFFAGEESNFCLRILCRNRRPFTFHVFDNFNQLAFRITREFQLCGSLYSVFRCCKYYVEVTDSQGSLMGYISNICFCIRPSFALYDRDKNVTHTITSPWCPCQNICCRSDIDYPVISEQSGEEVGKISKVYAGALKECCTTADTYDITFPASTPVQMKVLMLSAALVIDMMVYESKPEHGTAASDANY